MASDAPSTPASSAPLADEVDLREPIYFNLPPFPSTVIREPDLEHAKPCAYCGKIDCQSHHHRLVDPRGVGPDDPVVLIVEDCIGTHAPWRSDTPSQFLIFAAGTHARRSQAEAAGAVYASLAPPLETK